MGNADGTTPAQHVEPLHGPLQLTDGCNTACSTNVEFGLELTFWIIEGVKDPVVVVELVHPLSLRAQHVDPYKL